MKGVNCYCIGYIISDSFITICDVITNMEMTSLHYHFCESGYWFWNQARKIGLEIRLKLIYSMYSKVFLTPDREATMNVPI